MNLDDPVIAVIGAGAVGGYYGARLAQHGHHVHLLMRSDAAVVRQSGLRIDSRDGDFSLAPSQIHVHDDPRSLPQADLLLITLKTTANDRLGELAGPAVKDDSVILTLQNGLGNEQRLAELFGAQRVLGGMAFVCLNRLAPGHIVHSDHGKIQLGEYLGGPSPRARQIAALFRGSSVPCQVLENLAYGRWEKLVWNIPFNGLGALLDLTTDRLIGSPDGLALVTRLMQEVIDTSKALHLQLPDNMIQKEIEYTRTMGPYKTSTQIDRQKKRPLEVEGIWGEPLRTAQRNGVATPALETLYLMLKMFHNCGQYR